MLKQKRNWVVWGIREAELKAPFNPASLLAGKLMPAKAGVSGTWGSYIDAVNCVNCGLAQGIGFEFVGDDIFGVDLDHVIDETGTLTSQAAEVIRSLNSYTEISPSGKGVHIFVLAPNAEIVRHRKKEFFLEIYNKGRYFTVTGNVFGTPKSIETRTAELQLIHDKFLLADSKRNVIAVSAPHVPSAEQEKFLHIGLDRDKVFRALWLGKRRHGNESADDIALMNKLAYWCNANPDSMIQAFLASPYHTQKDSAHIKKCKRNDYLTNTANNACATVYSTAIVDYENWHKKRNRGKVYAR
jgi:putative DNA primase/helicase